MNLSYGFNQNSMKKHMVWHTFHAQEPNFSLVSEARLVAKQHPYVPLPRPPQEQYLPMESWFDPKQPAKNRAGRNTRQKNDRHGS